MTEISLDLNHWTQVVPEGGTTQTVTCRSFACFYAEQPLELNSEATELGVASSLTLSSPTGKWFRGKKASSSEIQKPSTLEVGAPSSPTGALAPPGAFKSGTAGYETEGEAKAIRDKLAEVIVLLEAAGVAS